MTIQLTPQQQADLDRAAEELVRVVDPRTNAAYVLVPADDFESVREALEDERLQLAVRAVALRNAVGRAGEEA
jgi:hypothetical protein